MACGASASSQLPPRSSVTSSLLQPAAPRARRRASRERWDRGTKTHMARAEQEQGAYRPVALWHVETNYRKFIYLYGRPTSPQVPRGASELCHGDPDRPPEDL